MKAKIYPSDLIGEITIPTSKSYAHRLIIIASFQKQPVTIHNIDLNNDIQTTINCLRNLGAIIEYCDHKVIISKPITKQCQGNVFQMNESGSTIRFLLPIISYLCPNAIIKAKGKLLERPMDIYSDFFKFDLVNNQIKIKTSIQSNTFEVDGSISSQFISGLLFYLAYTEKHGKIIIKNEIVSKNYLLMTIEVLKKFGYDVKLNKNIITINKHIPTENNHFYNEIDYSQAAFFVVANKIKKSNNVKITNLDNSSLQADKTILEIVKNYKNDDVIDLKHIPDLGPILIVLYLASNYTANFTNSDRLKIKESNRIQAMKENLHYFNYELIENSNTFKIQPAKKQIDKDIVINSFNDHRIAMSFAILATIQNKPVIINDAEAVNKSYPNFYNDLIKLGGKLELYE